MGKPKAIVNKKQNTKRAVEKPVTKGKPSKMKTMQTHKSLKITYIFRSWIEEH